MNAGDIFEVIRVISPILATVALVGTVGWIVTTWLRIKHGYPLDGKWGQAIYPRTSTEEAERIKLLSQENAQLRAELGSVKDRLGNIERIVTDSGYRLTHQINALRDRGEEGLN